MYNVVVGWACAHQLGGGVSVSGPDPRNEIGRTPSSPAPSPFVLLHHLSSRLPLPHARCFRSVLSYAPAAASRYLRCAPENGSQMRPAGSLASVLLPPPLLLLLLLLPPPPPPPPLLLLLLLLA
jgi:hypothetical protein